MCRRAKRKYIELSKNSTSGYVVCLSGVRSTLPTSHCMLVLVSYGSIVEDSSSSVQALPTLSPPRFSPPFCS